VWTKPPGLGEEVVLSVEPAGATGVAGSLTNSSWGRVKERYRPRKPH
jgi:hypothetical protein